MKHSIEFIGNKMIKFNNNYVMHIDQYIEWVREEAARKDYPFNRRIP